MLTLPTLARLFFLSFCGLVLSAAPALAQEASPQDSGQEAESQQAEEAPEQQGEPEEPKPTGPKPEEGVAKPQQKSAEPEPKADEKPEAEQAKPEGEEAKPEESSDEQPGEEEPDTKPSNDPAAPEGESEETPDNNPDKNSDANSEGEVDEQDESKTEATPESDKVEWDDKVKKVLGKSYPETVEDLRIIEKQTQRVLNIATPCTVSIQIGGAFGSGVIVSPDGLVLTAGHVCGRPGRPATFIFPDGRRVKGKTLGVNRRIDSGMAQITDPGPWPYMKMAAPEEVKNGQWVVAIGQPGGFDGDRTPPVRLGRVLFANENVINTDCTLVGGDSGGPLFNMKGEVIGIHSRIGRSITNNFHVPISTYHSTRERLVAGEMWGSGFGGNEPQRRWTLLGVASNNLDGDVRITQVHRGMPAEQAGIKVGDIVRTFNGESVKSSFDFAKRVLSSKPGSRVKLGLVRNKKPLEIEVRLAATPRRLPGAPDIKPPAEEEKG